MSESLTARWGARRRVTLELRSGARLHLEGAQLARFAACCEPRGECLIWIGPLLRGSPQFPVLVDGRRYTLRPARIACALDRDGILPRGTLIAPCERNAACIRPEHLREVARGGSERAPVGGAGRDCLGRFSRGPADRGGGRG